MADDHDHDATDPGGETATEKPGDDLGTKIATEVKKVLGTLLGDGSLEVGDEGDDGGDGSTEQPSEPSSPREVEANTESHVRALMGKLKAEEEHEAEHQKMKEREKPPMVVSRLTKALCGAPDA
jgi:hypothetical protein